jgi:hypothetical protein
MAKRPRWNLWTKTLRFWDNLLVLCEKGILWLLKSITRERKHPPCGRKSPRSYFYSAGLLTRLGSG